MSPHKAWNKVGTLQAVLKSPFPEELASQAPYIQTTHEETKLKLTGGHIGLCQETSHLKTVEQVNWDDFLVSQSRVHEIVGIAIEEELCWWADRFEGS
jgi:hypothetical protein